MTTFVAVLTPPGTAALASVGLWGPEALSFALRHFQPRGKRQPSFADPHRPWLGRLDAPEVCDDVVLLVAGTEAAPRVEINCHGGRAIVAGLVRLFVRLGAVEQPWTAWLRSGAGDSLQAEVEIALAHAPTLRAANHLLAQQAGALRRELESIQQDEANAVGRLQALLAMASFGLHLTKPWQALVAGPANAGKSSLINALVGYQRSIVSPLPGTTRDLVSTQTALDGWPLELIDTAGWRPEATGLEAQGIAKMLEQAAAADLVLWVTAPEEAAPPPPTLRAKRLELVWNKSDLPGLQPAASLAVSAQTGAGLEELRRRLVERLIGEPPPVEAPLLFTQRQVTQATAAKDDFSRGDGTAGRLALADLCGGADCNPAAAGVG